MEHLQLIDVEDIIEQLAEPLLTALYEQFKNNQITLTLQKVTKIIKERFQLQESPMKSETVQPGGDLYGNNYQIKKNDTLDTTYLIISIACHYQLKDYQTALIISHFCYSKYFKSNDQAIDSNSKMQTKWFEILCLEKLAQLSKCYSEIQTFMQDSQFTVLRQENAKSQRFLSFINILDKKSKYLDDFLRNKADALKIVTDEDKQRMSNKFMNLIQKQEEENYFQQHGVFAYLVSWDWLKRWKLFTKYYEQAEEDPEELKKDILNKNIQSSLDRSNSVWTALVKQFSDQDDQDIIQSYIDLEQEQLQTQIIPTFNDDLLLVTQPLLQDPWSVKDYCNYKMNPSAKENQDYFYLASYTWKELQKYFGGFEVKRLINAVDDSELKFSVENHPKLIKFIIYPQEQEYIQYVVQMSRNQTIKDFVSKVQRIFKFQSNTNMNVWKPQNDKKYQEFFKQDNQILDGEKLKEKVSLEDSAIGNQDILILEVVSELTRIIQAQNNSSKIIDDLRPLVKNICGYCQSSKQDLKFCQCYLVKYCDLDCQSNDRKKHQDVCKVVTNKSKQLNDKAKKYKIKPPSKITNKSSRGLCGLQNLGNTCFMNSGLQCTIINQVLGLSNVYELTQFLVSNEFVTDINEKNALGTGGRLISAYAELLKEMWEGNERYVSPWQLKDVIGKFASQFSGYNQQDSQELLTYLLDGIHEDLNRVKHKPYVINVDYKDQTDIDLSQIFWDNHLSRNNSIVTNIFTGQYKTKVKCPECNLVSITFDPFVSISLPIPNVEYLVFQFYLIFRDPKQTPQKISLQQTSDTTANEILVYLSKKANISLEYLQFYSFKVTIDKIISGQTTIKELTNIKNNVFAYELYDPNYDLNPHTSLNNTDGKITIYLNLFGQSGVKTLQQVSFARIISIPNNLSYYDIQIQIYRYIRFFLIKYIEAFGSKELSQTDKTIFESIYGENITNLVPELSVIEDEFKRWLDLNDQAKEPYTIRLQDNSILSSKKNSNFLKDYKLNTKKDIVLEFKLTFADYIRTDGLGMNKYVDSSFNINSKSDSSNISVLTCLELFGKKEILGVGNEWYCSKCKKHQRAAKKMKIYKAPKILILHLKRFRTSRMNTYGSYFSQGGTQKITSMIDYPVDNFDINDQVLSRKRDNSIDYTYDLFAVSNHYGGIGGGHYTAYAKNPIFDEWYDFNDSSVHKIKSSQVVTECAYVLFYRRRNANQKCQLLGVE